MYESCISCYDTCTKSHQRGKGDKYAALVLLGPLLTQSERFMPSGRAAGTGIARCENVRHLFIASSTVKGTTRPLFLPSTHDVLGQLRVRITPYVSLSRATTSPNCAVCVTTYLASTPMIVSARSRRCKGPSRTYSETIIWLLRKDSQGVPRKLVAARRTRDAKRLYGHRQAYEGTTSREILVTSWRETYAKLFG